MNDEGILPVEDIRMWIYTIRGKQVMLDRDLPVLYGVETKVLNQAVKRNIQRFLEDFRFRLNDEEKDELVTNCDRLNGTCTGPAHIRYHTHKNIKILCITCETRTKPVPVINGRWEVKG